LIVVVPVFGLLVLFAWKYRASNTKARYTPDWDRNRLAEIVWWLVPSLLILVISVITWNSSHQLDPYKRLDGNAKELIVQVVALDWKWLFIYPEQHIASVNFVQFPSDMPVDFEITADAPMNSFWIPRLGGQIYAMPGMSTQLHLMASTNDSFKGSSANISGTGFASMKFAAKSSSQADFDKWVQSARQSSAMLDTATYNELAKPSSNNPAFYYAWAQDGLYNNVIMKYMSPDAGMNMQPMNASAP